MIVSFIHPFVQFTFYHASPPKKRPSGFPADRAVQYMILSRPAGFFKEDNRRSVFTFQPNCLKGMIRSRKKKADNIICLHFQA